MVTETAFHIQRANERFHTEAGWLDSRHSFSFGHHWDPARTHFGLLLVNNDDHVRAGSGFSTHPHRDMEIVTWVLDGELEHKDSEGHRGVIYPGLAQRMSAGTGIYHSEMNHLRSSDVHFVQMWVVPDTASVAPGYQQADVNAELDRGGLTPIASGRGHDAAISLRQRDAVLWGARLGPDEVVVLPVAPFVHVFVAAGDATLEGAGQLAQGDAVRITASDGQRLVGGATGAEVLVWEMHADLQVR